MKNCFTDAFLSYMHVNVENLCGSYLNTEVDRQSVISVLSWSAFRFLRCTLEGSNAEGAFELTQADLETLVQNEALVSKWLTLFSEKRVTFVPLNKVMSQPSEVLTHLGACIETLLTLEIIEDDGQISLGYAGSKRKSLGAFFTPEKLIDCILEAVLEPILHAIHQIPHREERIERLLALRICDPACGAGYFLIAAAKRLANHLFHWTDESRPLKECLSDVVRHCLYGVDIDPVVLEGARLNLECLCGQVIPELEAHIQCGNALLDLTHPTLDGSLERHQIFMLHGRDDKAVFKSIKKAFPVQEIQRTAVHRDARVKAAALRLSAYFLPKTAATQPHFPSHELWVRARQGKAYSKKTIALVHSCTRKHRFFAWRKVFDSVFQAGGFDAMIGNPPFLDATFLKREQEDLRHVIRILYQSARGNWDIYIPFIELSLALLKADGRLGFVTPNKLVASDYSAALQHLFLSEYSLEAIHDFSQQSHFLDAKVPVVVAVIQARKSQPTDRVSCVQHVPYAETFCEKSLLQSLPSGYIGLPLTAGFQRLEPWIERRERLGDVATISDASSTSEAYRIQELVVEGEGAQREDDSVLKLINTGTIDPFQFLWGQKPIRYLGFKGRHPILPISVFKDKFARRYQQSLQTTVAVAGMGARLEAVVTPPLVLCGKSTVLIQPSAGICPYALTTLLNLDLWTDLYKALFGLRGLGLGSMNIGPRQMEQLPIVPPAYLQAFDATLQSKAWHNISASTKLSYLGQQLHQRPIEQGVEWIQLAEQHVDWIIQNTESDSVDT